MSAARVLVRGGGSIGTRQAEVFASLGCDVALWPVRPRLEGPAGARVVTDSGGEAEAGAADLVVVATDTARHVADALVLLEAGAARLLVEKPVAPTAADVAALLGHPRAGDVVVAAPLRAHDAFAAVVAWVHDGPRPSHAAAWCQSWLPDWRPGRDYRESYSARPDEGGVLRDLVHELDYLCLLLGEPSRVSARLRRDGPLDIDAEQAATLLWDAGTTTVQARLDYVTRPARRGLLLSGADGSISWDVLDATVTTASAGGQTQVRRFAGDLDRMSVMRRQAAAALAEEPGAPGRPAPASLADGVRVVALADAARACAAAAPRQE